MPKKRTKSQSTGELGEAIFRQFALENGLLPNKVEYDYGLDFLCQITGKLSKNIKTVNSQFIGVNVKSSKSKRIRATLNSDDMLTALQSDFPILFALIDINNKEVFFRFFDMDLLKVFSQLADQDKTFLLSPIQMYKDQFKLHLSKATRPEYTHKIRLATLELDLRKKIHHDIRLNIIQGKNGNLSLVETPCYDRLFTRGTEDFASARECVLSRDLEKTQFPLPLDIYWNLSISLNRISSGMLLKVPITPIRTSELNIKDKNGDFVSCAFENRFFDDEFSFYHNAGLSIIFSHQRKDDDNKTAYHHFELIFKDINSDKLWKHPNLVNFLKKCENESQLFFRHDANVGIQLSELENFVRLGDLVRLADDVYKRLNIDEPVIKLSDFHNDAILCSFSAIKELGQTTDNSNDKKFFGFVMDSEFHQLDWVPATIYCHFLFYLPDGETIIAAVFKGMAGIHGKTSSKPMGFQFSAMLNMRLVSCRKSTNDIKYPLLCLYDNVAIEFTRENKNIVNINMEQGMGIAYKFI